MNKLFAPFLPPWAETGLQPAFYDLESGTVLQQTARMYDKVNQLIRLFNQLSEETKATVEEYIAKFIELKDFVDDYFDNLDVQEEINNKLDKMAEDGTLQEIITSYIQAKAIWAFDSVADMQSATNLINGSYVETYGFYEKGDKGGAKYMIRNVTNDDTVDGITLIEITADPTNTLVAELVIEPSMNVKQFGAKGDNTTDDTTAIQTALDNVKNLELPKAEYKVVCVRFKDYQTIEGNGSKLNCELNTTAVIGFASHLTIRNLEIHSNNNDREWNRLDLRNNAYITFENCIFSGFQQQEVTPGQPGLNCWALYIRECHDIRVINCNFVDNNFQDVLIEFDNYNIYFENCTGSYNNIVGFYLDIEPSSSQGVNDNLTFVNCKIRALDIFEYFNTKNSNTNILFEDSIISQMVYKGGDVTFINSPILAFKSAQASDFLNGDGVVKFINSINHSENIIEDPYLKDLSNNENTYWKIYYCNGSWSTMATRISSPDGDYLSLNHNRNNNTQIYFQTPYITASEGEVFMLKQLSRAYYPTSGGAGSTAHHCRIVYYDNSNNVVSTLKLANNRGENNTEQKFSERTNIFAIPSGAVKFRVMIANTDSASSFNADYGCVKLFKLTCDQFRTNNIADLDFGNNKPYKAYENPNINKANKINHFTGERCYYESPSTYIGAVCTDGANNTYKEFGALAS